INKKEDLEYKPFKNISFNKLKTSLKNFLVSNKKINISDVKYVSFLGNNSVSPFYNIYIFRERDVSYTHIRGQTLTINALTHILFLMPTIYYLILIDTFYEICKYYNYEKIDNYGVNEICILGRSNVGKSTFLRNFIKYLINVNDNTNIKVSKRSGCTRSINLYSFENAKKKKLFILTDMPGLGYAEGIGEKKMEYLKKNLDDYVYLRNQICLFFILIDMSVDIQKIDISLVDSIRYDE
ncbi:probable GTP-binding protein engb-related, partial [Plasmodium yoelii yoelii]